MISKNANGSYKSVNMIQGAVRYNMNSIDDKKIPFRISNNCIRKR